MTGPARAADSRVDTHCWHVDHYSPLTEILSVTAGRHGVRCCVCPAIGYRRYEIMRAAVESWDRPPYDLVHDPVVIVGADLACPGYELRTERYAAWVANTVGYLALATVVLVFVACFLRNPELARFVVQYWPWWIAGPTVLWVCYEFLAHGHRELRRLNREIAAIRSATPAGGGPLNPPKAAPQPIVEKSGLMLFGGAEHQHRHNPSMAKQAPRFVVEHSRCSGTPTPDGQLATIDTDTALSVTLQADRWLFVGCRCTRCGDSFTIEGLLDDDAESVGMPVYQLQQPPRLLS